MKNLMEQQLRLAKSHFLFGTGNGESQLKKHPVYLTMHILYQIMNPAVNFAGYFGLYSIALSCNLQ